MSSGLYALIGVVVGGVTTGAATWFGQLAIAKRSEQAEWLVASRLVADELERLALDLRNLVRATVVPRLLGDSFLSTATWEEYRAVFARQIKNDNDGDEFWRGISRVMSTTSHGTRPFLAALPPGTQLDDAFVDALRDGFEGAYGAYQALTGVDPGVRPLEDVAPRSDG